ncbi:Ribosomal RNA large subunit methyltransferase L [compost metagenome]
MNRFFVVTPIGFEETTLKDLQDIWPVLLGKDAQAHSFPFPKVEVLKGGLEFECEMFLGLQLNFFLKTASRILLRMTSFKTRDFPKFYQKIKGLPWNEYLPHGHVEWVVSAQKSRLNNEKRLQESAEKAFEDIFGKPTVKETCASVFIRMDDDLCTISLDTSGEHLHKRGWTTLKGEAPLRETIAAYLVKQMMVGKTFEETSQVTLIDPMMGSGTFLTEARSLTSGQFKRSFAFQKWKKCPKLLLSSSLAFNYKIPVRVPFAKYVGFDLAEEMIPVAQKNFSEVETQLQAVQRKDFAPAATQFIGESSIIGEPFQLEGERWVISNPPYGERLTMALEEDGLASVLSALIAKFKPQRIGLLYPDRDRLKRAPKGYKILAEIPVNNGGLRTMFTILTAV